MINQFYNNRFPIISIDSDYFLRQPDVKDSEPFYNYYKNPLVHRYILASRPHSVNEATAEIHYCRNLYEYKRGVYWSLARKDDDTMIGAVGIYINNQHYRGELCYDLSEPYWQQGIMSRCLPKVLALAFADIGIIRLEAVTTTDNQASMKLLKKMGFSHEGRLHQYRYFNKCAHDVEMFALTVDQWQAAPQQESMILDKAVG